jgi:D-proline reductase (dithiol) PrdB
MKMSHEVDSYKFTSGSTRRVMQAWAKREPVRTIPWSPMAKPLQECTIALISSAAIACNDDDPFDQDSERRNPWWGDPTFRIIGQDASEADVGYYHLHVDASYAEQDINCVFPLRRLEEMQEAGQIGRCASNHYSFMGYLLDTTEFLQKTAPAIIENLQADQVDAAVLIPV